ncbi:TlyA family RNA methyltransferase [Geopsychrobacter electrodiphilus]|uniref:TlyA family RNA methyltransferase n=1 Tax=Geopsychrobacter electrodiphilus TaxID=225196 RepID=UPI000372CD63|nr:TlyA family RNA methyltransferase [Geopsychrobacter electrodiphilus]
MIKERLDKLLVDQGLVQSRERARALILAGQVIVDDHRVDKAGSRFSLDAELRLKGTDIPYVSRGGLKLQKGLDSFPVDPQDCIVLDVGASTGGFTDCLLQRGAAKVYAVDVGYGQLAWKLREDPRVINLERCNIRDITPEHLDQTPSVAVIDASFISLTKVLPPTLSLLTESGWVIALIKPQFEVGRGQVGKGGVVRDEKLHLQVVDDIRALAVELHCEVIGIEESPILGPKGNREFLICLQKGVLNE